MSKAQANPKHDGEAVETKEPLKLLNVEQLADALEMTERFIYERTAPSCPEPIPHFKLGKFVRFRLCEVEKWLQDHAR